MFDICKFKKMKTHSSGRKWGLKIEENFSIMVYSLKLKQFQHTAKNKTHSCIWVIFLTKLPFKNLQKNSDATPLAYRLMGSTEVSSLASLSSFSLFQGWTSNWTRPDGSVNRCYNLKKIKVGNPRSSNYPTSQTAESTIRLSTCNKWSSVLFLFVTSSFNDVPRVFRK